MGCDDGLFCTVGDTCQNGLCSGSPTPCPTDGPCVAGTCEEASKSCVWTPIPNGGACDDGDPCTTGETCSGTRCGNGAAPRLLFSETFANNSQGWTLGPEWELGLATASRGQTYGNPDPSSDYTGEGGVAGVVIGGNAATFIHSPEYLTSPSIDTTGVTPLYLTFYRWLNSDAAPYIFLYEAPYPVVFRKNAKGFVQTPIGYNIFEAAWLDT